MLTAHHVEDKGEEVADLQRCVHSWIYLLYKQLHVACVCMCKIYDQKEYLYPNDSLNMCSWFHLKISEFSATHLDSFRGLLNRLVTCVPSSDLPLPW